MPEEKGRKLQVRSRNLQPHRVVCMFFFSVVSPTVWFTNFFFTHTFFFFQIGPTKVVPARRYEQLKGY